MCYRAPKACWRRRGERATARRARRRTGGVRPVMRPSTPAGLASPVWPPHAGSPVPSRNLNDRRISAARGRVIEEEIDRLSKESRPSSSSPSRRRPRASRLSRCGDRTRSSLSSRRHGALRRPSWRRGPPAVVHAHIARPSTNPARTSRRDDPPRAGSRAHNPRGFRHQAARSCTHAVRP